MDLDEILRGRYPQLPWHDPVPVTVIGVGEFFVCRYCIARHGLRASRIQETPFAYESVDLALEHIDAVHP